MRSSRHTASVIKHHSAVLEEDSDSESSKESDEENDPIKPLFAGLAGIVSDEDDD